MRETNRDCSTTINEADRYGSLSDLVESAAFVAGYGPSDPEDSFSFELDREAKLEYLRDLKTEYGRGRSDGIIDQNTWKNIHENLTETFSTDIWIQYAENPRVPGRIREHKETGAFEVFRGPQQPEKPVSEGPPVTAPSVTTPEDDRTKSTTRTGTSRPPETAPENSEPEIPDRPRWHQVKLAKAPECERSIQFNESRLLQRSSGSVSTSSGLSLGDYSYQVFLETSDLKHKDGYQADQLHESVTLTGKGPIIDGKQTTWRADPTFDLPEDQTSSSQYVGTIESGLGISYFQATHSVPDRLRTAPAPLPSDGLTEFNSVGASEITLFMENCFSTSEVSERIQALYGISESEAFALINSPRFQDLLVDNPNNEWVLDQDQLATAAVLLDREPRFRATGNETSYLVTLNTSMDQDGKLTMLDLPWSQLGNEIDFGTTEGILGIRELFQNTVDPLSTSTSRTWTKWRNTPEYISLSQENLPNYEENFGLPANKPWLGENLLFEDRYLEVGPDGIFIYFSRIDDRLSIDELFDGCLQHPNVKAARELRARGERKEIDFEVLVDIIDNSEQCWVDAWRLKGYKERAEVDVVSLGSGISQVTFPNKTVVETTDAEARKIADEYLVEAALDQFTAEARTTSTSAETLLAKWAIEDRGDVLDARRYYYDAFEPEQLVALKLVETYGRLGLETIGSIPGIDTFGDFVFCIWDGGKWIASKTSRGVQGSGLDTSLSCGAIFIPVVSAGAVKATQTARSVFKAPVERLDGLPTVKKSANERFVDDLDIPKTKADELVENLSPGSLAKMEKIVNNPKSFGFSSSKDDLVKRIQQRPALTAKIMVTGDDRVIKAALDNPEFTKELKDVENTFAVVDESLPPSILDVDDVILDASYQRAKEEEILNFSQTRGPPTPTITDYLEQKRLRASSKDFNARGRWGEMRMDSDMLEQGWIPLSGKRITTLSDRGTGQGIDGLYVKIVKGQPKYRVVDAKSVDGTTLSSRNKASLKKSKSTGFKQLDDKWLNQDKKRRIVEMFLEGRTLSSSERAATQAYVKNLNINDFERVIYSVNEKIADPPLCRKVNNLGNIERNSAFPC